MTIAIGVVLQAQMRGLRRRYPTGRPNDMADQLIRDSSVARRSGSHDCGSVADVRRESCEVHTQVSLYMMTGDCVTRGIFGVAWAWELPGLNLEADRKSVV